ncbi:MAG: iron export ABC transporter permease subunit FetB [Deltaproteobacteria bacterium]|jgi:putative ABC transport system permease protein|nr:iron export ABC transporter permease subunit FetB [Deltaproteobacteria bacterium]MBT4526518.1 iron export ABC transporter permease subunit FetB [Deltaproteobacteria bacterium]
MDIVSLSYYDLLLGSSLIIFLSVFSFLGRLKIEKQLLVSAIRTTVQLMSIGYILKFIFTQNNMILIILISLVMLFIGAREINARQKRKMKGVKYFFISSFSMFVSSFLLTILTLYFIIETTPWYEARYAIPLLGMLLGNTMTGIALSLNFLIDTTIKNKQIIEQRLLLGQNKKEVLLDIRKDAIRNGMIPTINSMATAGLVSLPGMMTGQILAGNPPVTAVMYQILIMFLICGGTGFGVFITVLWVSDNFFDTRLRLKLNQFT